MKIIVKFGISKNRPQSSENIGTEAFAAIKALSPGECKNPNCHNVELNEEDPRLAEILRIIKEETGRELYSNTLDAEVPKMFYVRKERIYTKKDLSNAEFLCNFGANWRFLAYECEVIDSEHYVARYNRDYRPDRRIGNIGGEGYIAVNDEVRDLLLSENLKGLELIHIPTDKPLREGISSIWGISSNTSLPMNLKPIKNSSNKVFPGDPATWEDADEETGCYINDGLYRPAELVYKEAEFSDIDFDIALTYECFGPWKSSRCPYRIISQRFYQVLVKHKLASKLMLSPVRFE